ncbi:Holliday junction resolvase RuvX [Buchnera aphidicola]|uniref:Putative pre-16S rRNA nuclease n=1 Tax=Buchnera aphidicola (Anoecia oenotherae) TaxID=1241833 RepID=A0A4D6Y539_9GAMM|nr:Holliday junction resolvase RuvX [Buchnera aphidicola]QCI19545.1 Holliday junction resolvase RuvX [Buchnera aphidicola (Anoecia oenotherae)]
MTILAFDFGIKKIGVAIGQTITNTATILNPIQAKNGVPERNSLKKIFKEWNPKYVIIGLPLNLNGKKQKITYKTIKFAKYIRENFLVNIELHDERFTTVEAKLQLIHKYKKKSLIKKIDSLSAVIILESWLCKLTVKNKLKYGF